MGKESSPEHPEEQDSYRGELIRLYMVATLVAKVCKYHKINGGSMTMGCDGVEALKKSLDHDTSFSCRFNQFDIVTEIKNIIM